MEKITTIKMEISAHGEWTNKLEISGDYETIVKPELDRFYKHSEICMNKVIERLKKYNEGLSKIK